MLSAPIHTPALNRLQHYNVYCFIGIQTTKSITLEYITAPTTLVCKVAKLLFLTRSGRLGYYWLFGLGSVDVGFILAYLARSASGIISSLPSGGAKGLFLTRCGRFTCGSVQLGSVQPGFRYRIYNVTARSASGINHSRPGQL